MGLPSLLERRTLADIAVVPMRELQELCRVAGPATMWAQALLPNPTYTSSETLSPLLLSHRQLVGQLNWNDRQNGVTAKEACAFN